ncbi:hypothetical protein E2C01_079563 [Portunus trituberculatus]|uniref:Uncharacterized protein n=1 Tax=Portunus trituberculatus TaxID=210409 RepID=A0A5B7IQY9_PORTR|nr:hypothetical protein [Portunus trituberculatus]
MRNTKGGAADEAR